MTSLRLLGKGVCAAALPVVLAAFCSGTPAAAEKLSLAESVRIALQRNPSVQIARTNERKADAIIKQAFAAGLPSVTVEATYERRDKESTIQMLGQTYTIGSIDSKTGTLTVSQPVDIFGIVGLSKKAAEAGKAGYVAATSAQVNDTTLDAKTAYYNVLRAQAALRVAESTVETLQAHLKDTELHFQAGDLPKFDVLRAQTEVANARQSLISARNAVELTKASFNNVLGRPADTPVDLEDVSLQPPVGLQLAACADCARKWRPEVVQAEDNILMNDRIARATRLGNKPKIDARWTLTENLSTSAFNPQSSSWTGYLTASMPLFDGGATRAAASKAESDTKIAESVRDQVVLAVELDVKQSYLDTVAGRERVTAAETALAEARESMRLAQVRYQGGVSTQVEVLDAQSALTTAETNYVNAMYDYDIAVAQLERAVGGEARLAELLGAPPTTGTPQTNG